MSEQSPEYRRTSESVERLVDKFPAPAADVPPPGPEPELGNPAREAWRTLVVRHREFLTAVRRHAVAGAVDELRRKPPGEMTPADTIALYLGLSYLDGAGLGSPGEGLFGAL